MKSAKEVYQDEVDHFEAQIQYCHKCIRWYKDIIGNYRKEIKKLIDWKRHYQRLLKEEEVYEQATEIKS